MSADHGCRFRDDDRRVVCRCGWVSPSVGETGVAESFDHFDAVAPSAARRVGSAAPAIGRQIARD